jgi:hypothetical protein
LALDVKIPFVVLKLIFRLVYVEICVGSLFTCLAELPLVWA